MNDKTTVDFLKNKSNRFLFVMIMLCILPVFLWTIGSWRHAQSLNELKQTLDSELKLFSSNIVSELEKYEYLPILLSGDPLLKQLLKKDTHNKDEIDQVNRHLSLIQNTTEVSTVYLMNKTGLTLAASNWDKEDSFVGKNFKFRPYFKNAMQGGIGKYFALGTTSNIPGYYVSYPLINNNEISGVVVVKVSVARLENDWLNAQKEVFISDRNDVIIISGSTPWKFRTLYPINTKKRDELIQSRQYADANLIPIDRGRETTIDDFTKRLSIRTPTAREGNAEGWDTVYLRSLPVIGTDWTIHYVYRQANVRQDVINILIIAAFSWLITVLSILYILQRRSLIASRLEYQERHQRTLEEAAVELEKRVERRTRALSDSNQKLEDEIKERQKAEKDLHLAQDELVQAGKLAALGQMAAGITHEMNQPLTAIRSYADNAKILIERERLTDAQSNLGLITELCARLGKISGQLKVFARKTPSQKEPILLSKIITDTLNLLENSAKLENITITNNCEQNNQLVLGETVRLEQVLLNILRNAVDALSDQNDGLIELNLEHSENRMTLLIRDNGPGFKDNDLKHVFDPFFTTKEVGEGLGLGLSISSRIIQDFGGVLKARNHPDGGAVFSIELLKARDG
jgi:two-component system C4-dicarboxylate transport sensor histidine kinase DctB